MGSCRTYMVATLCLLLALTGPVRAQEWFSEYDLPFNFTCPPGQGINYIKSSHSDFFEDRVWNFGCDDVSSSLEPSDVTCTWHDFDNEYDGQLNHVCQSGGYDAGVYSRYSSNHRDRRYRFFCCHAPGFNTANCESEKLNNFDAEIDFSVPAGKVLSGMSGSHSDYNQDREFFATVCDLEEEPDKR